MEDSSLVSVVVPCYNHAVYLPEALTSIVNQTYENWECIIVNDGSPDNTEEIANHWINLDKRFKYLNKENGGLSCARNAGIEKARGHYILTLDADDKFEATFIEKAVGILNDSKEIGIVSCWGIRFNNEKFYGLFKPIAHDLKDFLFHNAISCGSALFRKICWSEVFGYDEQMRKGYEDWEFYIRISKNGWYTKIIEEPLFFYRQHNSSMRTVAIKNYDKEIRRYIFNKHKDLYIKFFDITIDNLLSIAELNKKNELKRINSIDYKIGNILLKPFRWIKSIFK